MYIMRQQIAYSQSGKRKAESGKQKHAKAEAYSEAP
jgi:hypothetical protein